MTNFKPKVFVKTFLRIMAVGVALAAWAFFFLSWIKYAVEEAGLIGLMVGMIVGAAVPVAVLSAYFDATE